MKQPLGWTLPTFSWYIDQTIAGAISTATHGSTLKYGSMSNLVSAYASSLNGLCAGSICTTEGPHGIIVIQPSQQAERQRPEETAVGYHKLDGSATSSKLTTRPVTALRSKVHYKPVVWSSIAKVLDGDVQVLEVEVALANGTLAVVDYQSNPHLFRALQVQFCLL